ncbi:hypothetical protein, partial [Hydrogenimonas sp.]
SRLGTGNLFKANIPPVIKAKCQHPVQKPTLIEKIETIVKKEELMRAENPVRRKPAGSVRPSSL